MEMASEQFLEAAKKGDLDLVRDMLHAGKVHVDVADINGNTALIAAAVRLSVTFSWVKFILSFYNFLLIKKKMLYFSLILSSHL